MVKPKSIVGKEATRNRCNKEMQNALRCVLGLDLAAQKSHHPGLSRRYPWVPSISIPLGERAERAGLCSTSSVQHSRPLSKQKMRRVALHTTTPVFSLFEKVKVVNTIYPNQLFSLIAPL